MWIIVISLVCLGLLLKFFMRKKDEVSVSGLFISQDDNQLGCDYVVLDTETTGLDEDAEIVEIAIVDSTGKVLLDTLVKPSKPLPVYCEASEIHGITNEMLVNAPNWQDIYEKVRGVLLGKQVLIYNAKFDCRLIQQTCDKYNLLSPIQNAKCVMLEYAQWYGEWNEYNGNYRWHKLGNAVRYLGLSFNGQEHRALFDCQAALGVWKFINTVERQDFLREQIQREQERVEKAKRKAAEDMEVLKAILSSSDYLVLNINALGKIQSSCLLEIAVVDMAGNVLLDSFVQPKHKIVKHPKYLSVLRMEASDFLAFPKWVDIYPKLIDIAANKNLIVLTMNENKIKELIDNENKKSNLGNCDFNFVSLSFQDERYRYYNGNWLSFAQLLNIPERYDSNRSICACFQFLDLLNHIVENGYVQKS